MYGMFVNFRGDQIFVDFTRFLIHMRFYMHGVIRYNIYAWCYDICSIGFLGTTISICLQYCAMNSFSSLLDWDAATVCEHIVSDMNCGHLSPHFYSKLPEVV